MKTSRAFTLVELLILLAVVAVLAAFLFPVLASARRRAKDAVSLSNLHQLGLACGLYHNDEGVYPESPLQLVPSYVNDAGVLAAPNDDSATGDAWLLLGQRSQIGTYSGRLSYAGAFEFKRTDDEIKHCLTTPGTTRGLLVDLSPLHNDKAIFSPDEGRYHRLTEDLSIVNPWFHRIPIKNGTCFLAASFLDDYDDAYIRDECTSL